MVIKHQPKGGMCAICKKMNADCSALDFKSMPSISRKPSADGIIIVKCTMFNKNGS